MSRPKSCALLCALALLAACCSFADARELQQQAIGAEGTIAGGGAAEGGLLGGFGGGALGSGARRARPGPNL
jgi:hypothetical protein